MYYSFDAAGNPLSDGATAFTWNTAGKLATTVNNGKTHAYKTNALAQRIIKNGPLSPKFLFFFDPNGQLIGEYRDNASTTTPTDDWLVRQETIWLDDIPVAVIKKPTATGPIQIYYIQADHLNTPRVIVNPSNTIVWRWENTHAFGANLPNEDPDSNGQLFEYHPRFPGQYFDKETSLHYNYFRYYEPETGRYISPDPIGLAGGMNVWGYVGGNPLSLIDPTGEIAWMPIIIGAALYAGSQSTVLQSAAASSSQYWADRQNQTGNSLYIIPGALAALADSCNIQTTTAVLGVGALTGTYLGRSFWQYYPAGNPAYSSSWFTRGWGWKPPYSKGQQAIEKLSLPAYNPATAVRSVNPPWWKPVGGPTKVPPMYGQTGGGTQYKAGGWP